MKPTVFIFWLVVLLFTGIACTDTPSVEKPEGKDIPLALEEKISFGHFFPQRELATTVEKDSQAFQNIPKELQAVEFKSFTFHLAQAYYQDYVKGAISEQEFQLLQQIYRIDTTQLSSSAVPSTVYIAIGELRNGNRALVVDTNLDLDFANEEVHEYDYPMQFIDDEDEAFYQQNKVDFLPKASIYYGAEAHEKFTLLLDPYEEDMQGASYVGKYFLSVSIPTILTQEISIQGQAYVVEAKSSFTQVETNPERLEFLFLKKEDADSLVSETNLQRYQWKDTVHLHNFDFQLQLQDKNLLLKNLGYNDRPTGIRAGYYLPPIQAKDMDGEAYKAKDYQGKHQLFFCWTSWSIASLEEVSALQQLRKDYPQVAIIGVITDSNQAAVERLIARQGMDWPTLFSPADAPTKHNPTLQWQVMSFPTYMLVDKEQKILYRTHHLKEIRKMLQQLEE